MSRGLDVSGLGRLLRRLGPWPGVLVLTYHRLAGPGVPVFDPDAMNGDGERFAAQLALLARESEVIGLDDLRGAIDRRRGRRVLITFDDGYRDNHDIAFPLLRQAGMPAVFFVATGFVDRPRLPWWDEIAFLLRARPDESPEGRADAVRRAVASYMGLPREQATAFLEDLAGSLGTTRPGPSAARDLWMTWDMVRELQRGGMEIGGHTVDHPVLSALSPDEQAAQIDGCATRLRDELGTPMRAFAYPFGTPGAFDTRTQTVLRGAGVEFAFEFAGGLAQGQDFDPLRVPRVAATGSTTPARLRAALTVPPRLIWT